MFAPDGGPVLRGSCPYGTAGDMGGDGVMEGSIRIVRFCPFWDTCFVETQYDDERMCRGRLSGDVSLMALISSGADGSTVRVARRARWCCLISCEFFGVAVGLGNRTGSCWKLRIDDSDRGLRGCVKPTDFRGDYINT